MEVVAKVYRRKTNLLINIPKAMEKITNIDKSDYVKIKNVDKDKIEITFLLTDNDTNTIEENWWCFKNGK